MPTYRELQFDSFAERRILPDLIPLDTPNITSLQGSDVVSGLSFGVSGGVELQPAQTQQSPTITQLNIGEFISDNAVGFDKLNIRFIFPNQDLQSSNFITGSAGWRIQGSGDVEFNDGTFRGALSASTIDIGGSDATSFHVDIDGNMWLGAATFNISTNPFAVSNAGVMRAVSGTIGGFTLGSTTITATNLTFTSGAANTANITVGTGATAGGLNAAAAGSDIVFWAGDTFANRATAEFRVTAAGALTATSATINGLNIGKGFFAGDGSDGALTVSSNTTLNPTYQVFNYTTLTINSGFTLDYGANFQNAVVVIHVQGDCTINGTLDLSGLGSAAGTGGAGTTDGTSNNGTSGSDNSSILDTLNHFGTGGTGGDAASVPGVGGVIYEVSGVKVFYARQDNHVIFVVPGAGGGGGGSGDSQGDPGSGAGGNGARGGGALILFVGGDLTFGVNAVIDLRGDDGTAGTAGAGTNSGGGAGGGGGGGGMGMISYNGTLTDSGVDIFVDGGAGAAGGDGHNGGGAGARGGDGGAGGGSYDGAGGNGGTGGGSGDRTAGTAGTSPGGNGGNGSGGFATGGGGGGGGGAGHDGRYILEENNNFA